MSNLTSNQFALLPIVGDTSLPRSGLVLSAKVYSQQGTPLVPGQVVKLRAESTYIPVVTAIAADADIPFGVVLYNQKNPNFPANEALEIGLIGTCVNMLAGGFIPAGSGVEWHTASSKVIAATGTKPIIGVALQTAAADAAIFRVLLGTPLSVNARDVTS